MGGPVAFDLPQDLLDLNANDGAEEKRHSRGAKPKRVIECGGGMLFSGGSVLSAVFERRIHVGDNEEPNRENSAFAASGPLPTSQASGRQIKSDGFSFGSKLLEFHS